MPEFAAQGTPLTQDGMNEASAGLGVRHAELWSVISVETSGCGFLPDRRPNILFERHVFHRLTGGKFDAADPDISQPTAGGYGQGGAHQYDRLDAAIALDRSAALQSASWGLGQVLGQNFKAAGAADVETLVQSMVASEDNQFKAMTAFIKSNGLDAPLQNHDWAGFARRYNGPNYAANSYDVKLGNAFQRYSAGPLPDIQVRQVQVLLTYKAFSPGGVDGIAGQRTTNAIKAFQQSLGKPQTGQIDATLLADLTA